MNNDNFLKIGKITKHQGIKGNAKLYYFGDLGNFNYKEVFLEKEGKLLSYFIEHLKPYKNFLIVKFQGINSINDVEKHLKGKDVFIKKEQLPTLEKDEYYWHELIDLKVIDEEGNFIGLITGIIETGSNDVFQVKNGNKEHLLPYTEEVVKTIDTDSSVMVVRMLEEV